jgi:hypothetical protein
MLITFIILLIIINIIDLIQTKIIFKEFGPEGELNPIVSFIHQKLGFFGIIIYKIILIGFAIWIILILQSYTLIALLLGLYVFTIVHNNSVIKYNRKILEEEN